MWRYSHVELTATLRGFWSHLASSSGTLENSSNLLKLEGVCQAVQVMFCTCLGINKKHVSTTLSGIWNSRVGSSVSEGRRCTHRARAKIMKKCVKGLKIFLSKFIILLIFDQKMAKNGQKNCPKGRFAILYHECVSNSSWVRLRPSLPWKSTSAPKAFDFWTRAAAQVDKASGSFPLKQNSWALYLETLEIICHA